MTTNSNSPAALQWPCPRWFELQLAGDVPQRLGFAALIGLAVATLVASPAIASIPAEKFTMQGIPWLLFSGFLGLFVAFVALQRVWPGTSTVECQPMALVRKTTKMYMGVNGVVTQWSDMTWPYSDIESCGILPPSDTQRHGMLVVCADGAFDVLAIPGDFPLQNLVQFLTARGVRLQRLTEIKREWVPTWQSPVKWIGAGIAAGVGLLALLVSLVMAASKPAAAPAKDLAAPPPAAPVVAPAVQEPPAPALKLVKTWKIDSGREPRTWAVSFDGGMSTYADFAGTIEIAIGEQPFKPLDQKFTKGLTAQFSADGSRLYYLTRDEFVSIDPKAGKVLEVIKLPGAERLTISHAGRLAGVMRAGSIELINLLNLQQRKNLPVKKADSGFIAFSANDEELLFRGNHTIESVHCTTGVQRELWKIPEELKSSDITANTDSRWLTFGSLDQVGIVPLDNLPGMRITKLDKQPSSLQFSRKQGTQIVGASITELKVMNFATKRTVAASQTSFLTDVRLLADDKRVTARSNVGTAYLWELP
ncbi:hypothetical protein [Anatilimnocola floriformis]|uniref:hypothetical protein n=1 Tax=Anatilimnocola floriformis TaxID=2948575 RepID=UPI0020C5497D|nr:hypothetical protein [Anatilimnocola floriformis]